MMRLTEEQKTLLRCYKGGKYKILREIRQGLEALREDGDEDGVIEELESIALFLENCTNKTLFEMKNSALLDTETEDEENVIQRTDS